MKKVGKRNKLLRRSWDATAHEFYICFTSVGESQDWNVLGSVMRLPGGSSQDLQVVNNYG